MSLQRTWAAVLTEHGPVAVITDEPDTLEARSAASASFLGEAPDSDRRRVWAMCIFDPTGAEGIRDPNDDRHGKSCGPGRPCGKCHETAQRTWARHVAKRQAAARPALALFPAAEPTP